MRESAEGFPADQNTTLHAQQNQDIHRTAVHHVPSPGHQQTNQHSSRTRTWVKPTSNYGRGQPLRCSVTNRGVDSPAMTQYGRPFRIHTMDVATQLALEAQNPSSMPTSDHQASYYGDTNSGREAEPAIHYSTWPGNPTVDITEQSRIEGHNPDIVRPAGYQAPYYSDTYGRHGYPTTVQFGTWLGNDTTTLGGEAQMGGQDLGFVAAAGYQASTFENVNGGNGLSSNHYYTRLFYKDTQVEFGLPSNHCYTPLYYNDTQVGFSMPSDNEFEDYVPISGPPNPTVDPHMRPPAENPKSASEYSKPQPSPELRKKKKTPFANLVENIQSHQISDPEGKIPHRGATKHAVLLPLATSDPDEFIRRFPNDLYEEYGWIVARNFGSAGEFIERVRHFHGPYDSHVRTLRWKNAQGKKIAKLGKELFGPLKGWRYKVLKVDGDWMDPETWRDEGKPKPVFVEVEEKEISDGKDDEPHADTLEDSVIAGEKEVGDDEDESSDADTFGNVAESE